MSGPTAGHEGDAVYELTVAGAIGPVLRSALAPAAVGPSCTCTIARTSALSGAALVDLFLWLDQNGLEVEAVLSVGW